MVGSKGSLFEDNVELQSLVSDGHEPPEPDPGQLFLDSEKIHKALDVVTDPATGQPVCAVGSRRDRPGLRPVRRLPQGRRHPGRSRLPDHTQLLGRKDGPERDWFPGGFRPRRSVWLAHAMGQERCGHRAGLRTAQGKSEFSPPIPCRRAGICRAPAARHPRSTESTPSTNSMSKVGCRSWSGSTGPTCSTLPAAIATPSTTSRTTRPIPTVWASNGRRCKEYKARGTYQRAIRAPNIIELYTPLGLNLFNMVQDPCGRSRSRARPGHAGAMPAHRSGPGEIQHDGPQSIPRDNTTSSRAATPISSQKPGIRGRWAWSGSRCRA